MARSAGPPIEEHVLSPAYHWNVAMFTIDLVTCWMAMTFTSVSSIIPAFVGMLTTSDVVIGLVGTIYNGCTLLPQLAFANRISRRKHKKPYLVGGILASRIPFWTIPLALYLGMEKSPTIMLIIFYICLGLFAAGDGIGSLAGLDIFARAVPLKRRGRLLGSAQFVSGILGIGIGVVVSSVVERLPFPRSYIFLFTAAGLCFIPSLIALALIREPAPDQITGHEASDAPNRAGRLRLVMNDRTLRCLVLSRLLVGMMAMPIPFYVGHAQKVLLLPPSIIGAFVIAQTVASVVSSPILGVMSERLGPQAVMRVTNAAGVLAPAFALATHLTRLDWMTRAYPFVYLALGIASNSALIGFFNYLIEIAPDNLRPVYIGASNALLGVIAIGPVIGGWLLQSTSYTVLFATTTVVVLLGFLVSLRLGPPVRSDIEAMEHIPLASCQGTPLV